MDTTITLERDLVTQGGRILGRLERWDLPVVLGRRCHSCDGLVPVRDWDYHQAACHSIGWGGYHNTIARFKASATKRRPQVDWAAELARFLK